RLRWGLGHRCISCRECTRWCTATTSSIRSSPPWSRQYKLTHLLNHGTLGKLLLNPSERATAICPDTRCRFSCKATPCSLDVGPAFCTQAQALMPWVV